VPKNCVLIGLAGQGKTRGTVAINKVELCTNQSIAAILPSDEVFYEYLYYNLDSRYFELRGLSTGDGGRGGLNLTIIKNLLIPLPPTKAEQTAIATALSDADALINSLEKLIAKKRNIKQGAMQHLLKPKEGWEVKKLGEIAAFFKGKGLPKSHLKENGKYKCIHYGELFTKYKESISSILSYTNENENCFFSISNDVLMPTSDVTPNGLATASCIKQDGIILGGDVLVIRILPSILDGLFLSFYVSQNREKVMKLVSGSTVYHLYGSDMKDFEISYPKTEQQNEIATILSDMDAEIQALETKLEKYRKIKLGMMQVLLTGKVRLV
jgi:type I restriction enzyme S subunit